MQHTNELVYYNTDAEESLLGEIFFNPDNIKRIQLREEHMYHKRNSIIFKYMRELEKQNKEISPIELSDIMMGEIENVGGLQYLTQLMNVGFNKSVIPLEKIITNLYVRRETVKLNQRMSKDMTEGVDPVLAMSKFNSDFDKLQKANTLDDDDDGHISKVMNKIAISSEVDKGEFVGARTHFRDLDNLFKGIKRKTLNILAARPSVGKTALAMDIGKNYSLHKENDVRTGGPTIVFSIEMPEEELGERMLSSLNNIDGQKIKNPKREFDENEWLKMYNGMGELSEAPIHIFDESEVDLNFVRRKCRMLADKYPGEQMLIIIDYIQMMKGDPRFEGNRNLQLDIISKGLKDLAKELGSSVIALSQLSRGVEQRQDKRPMLSDLRDSGGLEAAADGIWMLYRDDYYDKESEKKGLIEVIVGKQRGGSIGTVMLAFKKEISKFIDVDWSR